VPRTFIFGGKAAPGYFTAKLIIKLINSVGDVVNNDPDVRDRLKVEFIPNFSVKLGHRVYPIADLSEQISTAGKEASGTGNMKFAMNGALTVGTLDGANIEIREEVGAENFFLFGLTAQEVMDLKSRGYNPRDYYNSDDELQTAIARISSGHFSHGDGNLFRPLVNELMSQDQYMLLHAWVNSRLTVQSATIAATYGMWNRSVSATLIETTSALANGPGRMKLKQSSRHQEKQAVTGRKPDLMTALSIDAPHDI